MSIPDIIILGGSPGTGKSTAMRKLHVHFRYPPCIEFSDVRNLYLDPKWERVSSEEEAMAFDILLYALKKIVPKNLLPILLTDFQDERLASFQSAFTGYRYRIITLYAENDEIVKDRIISRNDGFKDFKKAMAWNSQVRIRNPFPFEDKVKIDGLSESAVLDLCLDTLKHP